MTEGQEIRCRISKKVFRQASFYAMFLRERSTFRIGVPVVLSAVCYTVMGARGLFPVHYLPVYIAAAYLVWMLLLLGREERRILHYLNSPACMLGVEYVLRFDDETLVIEIPERKIRTALPAAALASAFEISGAFLLCLSARQLYLIPTQAMTPAQRRALRALLRRQLQERFFTTQKD